MHKINFTSDPANITAVASGLNPVEAWLAVKYDESAVVYRLLSPPFGNEEIPDWQELPEFETTTMALRRKRETGIICGIPSLSYQVG